MIGPVQEFREFGGLSDDQLAIAQLFTRLCLDDIDIQNTPEKLKNLCPNGKGLYFSPIHTVDPAAPFLLTREMLGLIQNQNAQALQLTSEQTLLDGYALPFFLTDQQMQTLSPSQCERALQYSLICKLILTSKSPMLPTPSENPDLKVQYLQLLALCACVTLDELGVILGLQEEKKQAVVEATKQISHLKKEILKNNLEKQEILQSLRTTEKESAQSLRMKQTTMNKMPSLAHQITNIIINTWTTFFYPPEAYRKDPLTTQWHQISSELTAYVEGRSHNVSVTTLQVLLLINASRPADGGSQDDRRKTLVPDLETIRLLQPKLSALLANSQDLTFNAVNFGVDIELKKPLFSPHAESRFPLSLMEFGHLIPEQRRRYFALVMQNFEKYIRGNFLYQVKNAAAGTAGKIWEIVENNREISNEDRHRSWMLWAYISGHGYMYQDAGISFDDFSAMLTAGSFTSSVIQEITHLIKPDHTNQAASNSTNINFRDIKHEVLLTTIQKKLGVPFEPEQVYALLDEEGETFQININDLLCWPRGAIQHYLVTICKNFETKPPYRLQPNWLTLYEILENLSPGSYCENEDGKVFANAASRDSGLLREITYTELQYFLPPGTNFQLMQTAGQAMGYLALPKAWLPTFQPQAVTDHKNKLKSLWDGLLMLRGYPMSHMHAWKRSPGITQQQFQSLRNHQHIRLFPDQATALASGDCIWLYDWQISGDNENTYQQLLQQNSQLHRQEVSAKVYETDYLPEARLTYVRFGEASFAQPQSHTTTRLDRYRDGISYDELAQLRLTFQYPQPVNQTNVVALDAIKNTTIVLTITQLNALALYGLVTLTQDQFPNNGQRNHAWAAYQAMLTCHRSLADEGVSYEYFKQANVGTDGWELRDVLTSNQQQQSRATGRLCIDDDFFTLPNAVKALTMVAYQAEHPQKTNVISELCQCFYIPNHTIIFWSFLSILLLWFVLLIAWIDRATAELSSWMKSLWSPRILDKHDYESAFVFTIGFSATYALLIILWGFFYGVGKLVSTCGLRKVNIAPMWLKCCVQYANIIDQSSQDRWTILLNSCRIIGGFSVFLYLSLAWSFITNDLYGEFSSIDGFFAFETSIFIVIFLPALIYHTATWSPLVMIYLPYLIATELMIKPLKSAWERIRGARSYGAIGREPLLTQVRQWSLVIIPAMMMVIWLSVWIAESVGQTDVIDYWWDIFNTAHIHPDLDQTLLEVLEVFSEGWTKFAANTLYTLSLGICVVGLGILFLFISVLTAAIIDCIMQYISLQLKLAGKHADQNVQLQLREGALSFSVYYWETARDHPWSQAVKICYEKWLIPFYGQTCMTAWEQQRTNQRHRVFPDNMNAQMLQNLRDLYAANRADEQQDIQ